MLDRPRPHQDLRHRRRRLPGAEGHRLRHPRRRLLHSDLGELGCGKSTTLRCVAGLEEPDGGSIEIGGEVVTDTARGIQVSTFDRDIGLVFQSYAIWRHMDVFANVAYPLKVQRPRLAAADITARGSWTRCVWSVCRTSPHARRPNCRGPAAARRICPRPCATSEAPAARRNRSPISMPSCASRCASNCRS